MRILHIIQTLNPAAGGPAEAARLLVEFAPPDIESEIVTLDDSGEPFLAAFACPVHALAKGRGVYGYNAALTPWLRANRLRFDAAVVHGLWTYIGDGARRALAGKTPYAVFPHGMLDPYFKRTFPMKHAKKWMYWLGSQYWTLRRSERVLFTTQAEAELATQSFWLHRWKPMIVALGTMPQAAVTAADHEAFLAKCAAAKGRRFILFLGRVHPKKGVDLLVEAFAQVAAENTALDLVIAGPDSDDPANATWLAQLRETALRAGSAHRIHWPGMLKGQAKRGAFDLCEAFILPSHQENFGIAVAEALAAARPVLISDKVNIATEIAADGCGFVETDTLDGTLRLLRRWLALSPNEPEAMSAAALATFNARYDMRKNAAAIADVFNATS